MVNDVKQPVIKDWDDAYSNGAYIDGADDFPPRWALAAEAFRAELGNEGRAQLDLTYGDAPREKLDLFMPKAQPKGLVMFVHGGYWMAFDKSSWSHLAKGALDNGWAVALPSYTLAPEASLTQMTGQIARAIEFAAAKLMGQFGYLDTLQVDIWLVGKFAKKRH